MPKFAINGMGRIGRAAFKVLLEVPDVEIVALNDLMPVDNLAYLLRHDTVYRRYPRQVEAGERTLVVDGHEYQHFNAKDPAQLPWSDLGVDVALECTGIFTHQEGLEKHLQAGAKWAVLSAPAKGDGIPAIVYGVNRHQGPGRLLSCASCTTNCISPVIEVMGRRIGIKKAVMTALHAYTATQSIVDKGSKKWTRGRAGAANFVPTTTGAAIATTRVLPAYEGLFDGVAVRGPVPAGSIADIVFLAERKTSVDEVNDIFREESRTERYREVLGVAEEPLVSSDIIGDPRASVINLQMTKVIDGDLVKVMSWYDNEWGFTNQMVREALRLARGQA